MRTVAKEEQINKKRKLKSRVQSLLKTIHPLTGKALKIEEVWKFSKDKVLLNIKKCYKYNNETNDKSLEEGPPPHDDEEKIF